MRIYSIDAICSQYKNSTCSHHGSEEPWGTITTLLRTSSPKAQFACDARAQSATRRLPARPGASCCRQRGAPAESQDGPQSQHGPQMGRAADMANEAD